jgi:heptosyltransferase-2
LNTAVYKILIIRLSSLGDVLLASPLVRSLREKFKNAQIDFLIRSEYIDIVRHNPHLTNVVELNAREGFPELRKLKKHIYQEKYHVILDIHKNLRSIYLCWGMQLRGTQIYKIKKQQFVRFLLIKLKINLYQKFKSRIIPVWEKYLQTADRLGIDSRNGTLELFLPAAAENRTVEFLNGLPGTKWEIVVAPGAKHFTKRWPPEYFAELIKQINRGWEYQVILVGDNHDKPVIEKILDLIPKNIAISTAGFFSIIETSAIIKRAKLIISNDSGIMHIAKAFNRPLVAIFGSTVKEFGFYPSNKETVVIERAGLQCRPCSHIGRKACPKKHFKCMKDITPEMIIQTVEEMQILK